MARERIGTARQGSTENVRMGPVALFTMVAVLCLAVLAVLAVSTGQATLAMSQRRAEATSQTYLYEAAAQAWLAELDAETHDGDSTTIDDQAIQSATDTALAAHPTKADQLYITTSRQGNEVLASFDMRTGRQLDVRVCMDDDGSLLVRQWRMTTVVNDEPTMGTLLGTSQ